MQRYQREPYDVLQVSRDHGKTWADYCTIRDGGDAKLAEYHVLHPAIPEVSYRIKRGADVIFTKPEPKKPTPSTGMQPANVGELRKLIEGLPDDALILPDWGTVQPSPEDPGIEIEGIRVGGASKGAYLCIAVKLFHLEG